MKTVACWIVMLYACASVASAEELGALSRRFSWPSLDNNLSTFMKSTSGSASDSAAEMGQKTYAVANFHALSALCESIGGTPSGSLTFDTGAQAYWFTQMTISSPGVAVGTIGSANFTLLFEGDLSAGPGDPRQSAEYRASVGYNWSVDADNADGIADPNTGTRETRTTRVYTDFTETTGPDFLNQPRQHKMNFRFGVPFDFTLNITALADTWQRTPGKARARITCTGWNGFQNITVGGVPVTDATLSSQTGFNYIQPGTTTYAQWASLYELGSNTMHEDSNQNGLSEMMEFALGRNPVANGGGAPFTPGLTEIGGQKFSCFTFMRPALGARAAGISYNPQRSTSLTGWNGNGVVLEAQPAGFQREMVTVRSTEPVSANNEEFIRLEVTGP